MGRPPSAGPPSLAHLKVGGAAVVVQPGPQPGGGQVVQVRHAELLRSAPQRARRPPCSGQRSLRCRRQPGRLRFRLARNPVPRQRFLRDGLLHDSSYLA